MVRLIVSTSENGYFCLVIYMPVPVQEQITYTLKNKTAFVYFKTCI